MNPTSGEFVGDELAETWMQRIAVGETVKIKGEELEVVSIGPREITLKLLSQGDRDAKAMRAALDDRLSSLIPPDA